MVVDVERGRTIKGWKPRRLGGGKGGRKSHYDPMNDQNRSIQADENLDEEGKYSAPRRDREYERVERDSSRGRDRDRSRRSREKSKSRSRSRSRNRDRERKKRSKSRGTCFEPFINVACFFVNVF